MSTVFFVETRIQRQIASQRQMRVGTTIYIIPVVIHVLNKGGVIGTSDNPNDTTLQKAITGLNNYWRRALPASGGADIEIQFELATRAPNCSLTSGTNRVDGREVPDYETNEMINTNELALKNLLGILFLSYLVSLFYIPSMAA